MSTRWKAVLEISLGLEDVSSSPFLQKGGDAQCEDAISVGNRTWMETNDHVFVARLGKSHSNSSA
jgi:hypothetical protein